MAREYQEFLTSFTAQASAAIVAGAYSAGAQTAYSTLTSGNMDGCYEVEFELDVTVAPAADDTTGIIYQEARNFADTSYGEYRYVASVIAVGGATGVYSMRGYNLVEKGRFVIFVADAGDDLTCSLTAAGVYISAS